MIKALRAISKKPEFSKPEPVKSVSYPNNDIVNDVLNILKSSGELTRGDIVSKSACCRYYTDKALSILVDRGCAERSKKPNNKNFTFYKARG